MIEIPKSNAREQQENELAADVVDHHGQEALRDFFDRKDPCDGRDCADDHHDAGGLADRFLQRLDQPLDRQLTVSEAEDQREDDAYHRKGRECDAESLFLLLCAAVRVGLGDEARECNGKTRCCQSEEDEIDTVGAGEHGIAFIAQYVAERYFIDEAQQLHYDNADGEYRRAVYKILLLCHAVPS